MWILSVTQATVAAVATGAAGAASSDGASSSASSTGVVGAFTPSRTSYVNGQRESQVFVSFAPSTSSIVRHPSRFNNPESTRSSKIAGSSRLAGSIVIPASVLQLSTSGSFSCAFAVSAVIDILFPSLFLFHTFSLLNIVVKKYIYSCVQLPEEPLNYFCQAKESGGLLPHCTQR